MNTKRSSLLFLAFALAVLTASQAPAQMSYGKAPRLPKEPELPPGVGIEQHLGDKIPLDLVFVDHLGHEIALKDCVNGKPTLMVLAYYSCPKLCTEVLNGLVREMKALNRLGLSAGKDFNVITVSINPMEAPTFARMKRQSYLNEYDKRPESEAGWWFLTASHGQGTNLIEAHSKVQALANSVGFKYAADNQKMYEQADAEQDPTRKRILLEKAIRKTKEYVHPSTVIVLTPDGTISQYHHGLAPIEYNAEDIRTSLSKAAKGQLGSLASRAAMLCFAYDSTDGHYKPVMRVMGLLAVPVGLLTIGIAYATWRRARREKPIAPSAATEVGQPMYVQTEPNPDPKPE